MKKAFTLIELLVVIAIIAILAAILFPVFTQAKLAAKKTQDLSNVKQIGTAMQIYLNDSDDVFPSAYFFNNNANATGGVTHWSGAIQPYTKSTQIFVSPGDKVSGLAPANFLTNNLGTGVPAGQTSGAAVQDNQAPRLSYTANASLMPAKPTSVAPATSVSNTVIEGVSSTILLAPLTDSVRCLTQSATAAAAGLRTHRPANAYLLSNNGAPFTGEVTNEYTQAAYWAPTGARAKDDVNACTNTAGNTGQVHLVFTSPLRFGNGANYAMADSSAKFQPLEATVNPSKFLWGTFNYSAGSKPVYKPGTANEQVQ